MLIAYNSEVNADCTFDHEYQEIFADEGERKAQYIIADLLSKFNSNECQLNKFAYLSIGGADGSEPEAILKSTDINHAIIIEHSDTAAEKARQRSLNLKEKNKFLYVFQGDANQRLDDALLKLNELKSRNDIHGLIVSAQAVLHELPRRSPNFNLHLFIGRCFSIFEKNVFYSREPIYPQGWPEFIEIAIPGVAGTRLKVFSCLINDRLSISDKEIEAVGNNYVHMENILALEVLHKLLRCRSVREFTYELNEQLTSINTNEIQQILEKDLGAGSTRIEPFITEGFRDEWIANKVLVRNPRDGRSLSIPNTHARILGISLQLNTAVSHDITSIWTTHPISDNPIKEITHLNEELNICRNDRVGKSRKEAILSILEKVDKSKFSDFYSMELKVRLWRELTFEARNQKDFMYASEKTKKALEFLPLCCSTEKQKKISYELLIEWSIDFAQSAGTSVGLNVIVSLLNRAGKYIGKQIIIYERSDKKTEEIAHLLCLRAKCSRALASLYLRRCQTNTKTKKQVNNFKNHALYDAYRANQISRSYSNKLELALCLFANSGTTDKDTANRGLKLLETAWFESFYVLAGYELVKQYKLRHRFEDAINVFLQIEKLEDNRRRFHKNVINFSASVIGLHYDRADSDLIKQNALIACQWFEEIISYDRHQARDVVDFCHLRAICGFPFEKSVETLEILKPTSDQTWNQIVEIAKTTSFGGETLDDALLMGLENAIIWSKIGSLYLEFTGDCERAIEFYDRASLIDPLSPIFYFNKAEALAYCSKDFESAKISLDYALNKKHQKWLWYKSSNVQKRLKQLKKLINLNLNK